MEKYPTPPAPKKDLVFVPRASKNSCIMTKSRRCIQDRQAEEYYYTFPYLQCHTLYSLKCKERICESCASKAEIYACAGEKGEWPSHENMPQQIQPVLQPASRNLRLDKNVCLTESSWLASYRMHPSINKAEGKSCK